MRARMVIFAAGALGAILAFPRACPAQQQIKKDYLSDTEADKIRDAGNSNARMVLFASFAEDRINKLKYVLAHPNGDRKRADQINALINGYSGCIDDAADLIEVAKERQQDIRAGLKALTARAKDSLPYLQGLQKNGPELDTYKDTLDDAVEATQDALSDAEKAAKEISAPIRRKQ